MYLKLDKNKNVKKPKYLQLCHLIYPDPFSIRYSVPTDMPQVILRRYKVTHWITGQSLNFPKKHIILGHKDLLSLIPME